MSRIAYATSNDLEKIQELIDESDIDCHDLVVESDLLHRPCLESIVSDLGPKDEVVVAELGGLGETLQEVEANVARIHVSHASLRVLNDDLVLEADPDCSSTRVLQVAAQLARNADLDEFGARIEEAESRGAFLKGRPRAVNEPTVLAMRAGGLGATEIARRLGVSRTTVYRYFKGVEEGVAPRRRRPARAQHAEADDAPAGRRRPRGPALAP